MDENKFVTKAKLAQGKFFTEEVETEDGIFRIRQLTYGEKGIADSLATKGLLKKSDLDNIENIRVKGEDIELVSNMHEYHCHIMACALSLDEPNAEAWTIQDIKDSAFKPTTAEDLVNAIEASNGMGNKGVNRIISPFRKDKIGNENDSSNSIGKDTTSPRHGEVNESSS